MFWFCLLLFVLFVIVSLFLLCFFSTGAFQHLCKFFAASFGMPLAYTDFWIMSTFTYAAFVARILNINLTAFFPYHFQCITKDLSKLLSSSKWQKPCTQNETKSCFVKYIEIMRNLRYYILLNFLAKIFCLIHQILAIKNMQRIGRIRNSGLKGFHRTKYLFFIKGRICLKLRELPSMILLVQPLVPQPGAKLLCRAQNESWSSFLLFCIILCQNHSPFSHAVIY